jgi:hypothetical protein
MNLLYITLCMPTSVLCVNSDSAFAVDAQRKLRWLRLRHYWRLRC